MGKERSLKRLKSLMLSNIEKISKNTSLSGIRAKKKPVKNLTYRFKRK